MILRDRSERQAVAGPHSQNHHNHTNGMLAQLTPQSATAAAAIVTAAIAAAAAIIKKLLPRKEQPKPDHVTRTEFHQGLDKLTEKIENLSTSIHTRLARIEAGLARLDERTKF